MKRNMVIKRTTALLLTGLFLMGVATNAPVRAEVTEKGLFGLVEISSDNLAALPLWLKVKASFPQLANAAAKCDARIEDCQSQQMTLWRTKIAELQNSPKRIQMQEMNRFLNGWKYVPADAEASPDGNWASPLEFISNGGGSRDFAIMKYISLKELGFDPDAMRIVIANDVLRNKVHAVLSVTRRGKRYVLDSLNDTILEERLVNYYVPLYSVNENKRWAHIPIDFLTAQDAAGSNNND
ncbi:transglutaminase-like cysteine peptidase [Sneathiella sp.]|uniref:transglutaminase-like cysteine peptidase n=1 Tax=Sneathiella sp. TaxID=1964365 RepID=UPI0026255966|nr:transglutaminase-like cysteine peptidase [Sneathiella sp.]MDF2366142.1 transglutaminase-like cysteine peptidase [Sneathiella sp.]